MNFLLKIIEPLEWVVANIMVLWHQALTFIGFDSAVGATWALSIVGLVVTIRIAADPGVREADQGSRAMQMIAPELQGGAGQVQGQEGPGLARGA